MQSNSHGANQAYQETYPLFSSRFDPSMGFESGAGAGLISLSTSSNEAGYTVCQGGGGLTTDIQETSHPLGSHTPWAPQDFHDASLLSSIVAPTSGLDFVNTPIAFNDGMMNYDYLVDDMSQPFSNMNLPVAVPDNVSYNQDNHNVFNVPTISVATAAAPPAPTSTPQAGLQRFACTFCASTYKRDKDRKRHEQMKHLNNNGPYLCQVPGCPNANHVYTRKDKLTEHMWKAHADLGYAKRVVS